MVLSNPTKMWLQVSDRIRMASLGTLQNFDYNLLLILIITLMKQKKGIITPGT